MYEKGTLFKFLEDVRGGAPVTLKTCDDQETIYQITKMAVIPPEIIKGESLKMKILGTMKSEQELEKLTIDTNFNGSPIYNENVKKDETVKIGTYIFEHSAAVPTFTPSGNWEIIMKLLNKNGDELCCLRATFEMP